MIYHCHLCDSENEITKFGINICSSCCSENTILDPNTYHNLSIDLQTLMQRLSDYVIVNNKYSYDDSYVVKRAKNAYAGIYTNILDILKHIIKTSNIKIDVDYENIQGLPNTIRTCDRNRNKICNHCGDC